jgi:quinoprotein glucose dehydrogenase
LPNGASIPCYAGPYGELVAINVNTGAIAWKSVLGINEEYSDLGEKGVKTGARNLGGSISTAGGLVFIGATNDKRFRAFDAKTGRSFGWWSCRRAAIPRRSPTWARTASST